MKKNIIIAAAAAAAAVIAVSLVGISVRSSHDFAAVSREAPVEIIFVPGFMNKNVPQNERLGFLKKIFPEGSSISVEPWNSGGGLVDFNEAFKNADRHAAALAGKIASFPVEKQKKLVLVGHSLGGRIVVRTMALLRKKGISIRRGIFLGAAIPDDDPDVGEAIEASLCPNVNIYSRKDSTLLHVYSSIENLHSALGAYGCALPFRHGRLQQFPMKGKSGPRQSLTVELGSIDDGHDAELYLNRLCEVFRQKEERRSREIDSIGKAVRFFWAGFLWSSGEERSGYKIQRNWMTGAYRLLSPAGLLLRVGSSERCREEADSLTKIDRRNSAARINAVRVTQGEDRPAKIFDKGWMGWKTLEDFHHWRLQRHWLTSICRIVDPRDYQRAHGGEAQMRAAFENIKVQWRTSPNK